MKDDELVKALRKVHDKYRNRFFGGPELVEIGQLFDVSATRIEQFKKENAEKDAIIAELKEAQRWIPVTPETMPPTQKKVIVRVADNTSRYKFTTTAAHLGYHEQNTSDYGWDEYEGDTEYDEEKDCFWVRPGWYEVNAIDDNPNYELDGYEVTHWMPLPEPPAEKG